MGSLAGTKWALLAVVALLAMVVASCGDEDSPSTEVATTGQGSGKSDDGGKDKASSRSSDDGPGGSGSGGAGGGDPAAKQHDDSGGGSAQYRVKGGDNSVQDFGSEASEAELDAAAAALHGFFDARVRGDWETACSYLAGDVVESLKRLAGSSEEAQGEDCVGTLETLAEGVPQSAFEQAAVADVGSLRVEGERAFVLYRGSRGVVFAMPMQNQDGGWKVGAFAGTPIS